MRKEDVLAFLKENKELLATRFKVKNIGIFGSFARNEAMKDSDIDIIVDMPPSFDSYYDLKEFLEKSFKRTVDLGLKRNIRTFIKKSIEKDIIYV